MTAKRKLLLFYAAVLGNIVVFALLVFYLDLDGLLLLLLINGLVGLNLLLGEILHPFPRHRVKLSSYGLAVKIYCSILGVGLASLVFVSFYVGFINQEAAHLIKYGIRAMLIACIPLLIIRIYEEIKLAAEKDKEALKNSK